MPIKIQDIVRPQKDDSVRVETTFTKEQFKELKQAKSFLSHVVHNGSWAEVITALATKLNQSKIGKPVKNKESQSVFHKDPQPIQSEADFELSQKPQSGSATEFKNPQTSEINPSDRKRASISVHTKRALITKAEGCCQFITANGLRCGSQFQVQIDHITPITWGGSNEINNLRVLCRTHNLLMARQMRLVQ